MKQFSRLQNFGTMPIRGQIYWARLHVCHFLTKWAWFVLIETVLAGAIVGLCLSLAALKNVALPWNWQTTLAACVCFSLLVASMFGFAFFIWYVIKAHREER